MTALCTAAFRPDPLAEPPPPARDERIALWLSIAFATALHLIIGASLSHRNALADVQANAMEVIEVTPPEPPPFEPKSDKQREEPPSPTTPTPEQPSRVQPPSAAAAQAAQVLTRSEDTDKSLDLTDAIVTGSAATYAGGTTSSSGTSAKAVRGRSSGAVVGGPVAGRPSAPESTAEPDRSRKAELVGRLDWSCPFPSETDADGIDYAVVTLAVVIGASAKVESVAVSRDPGHGFGAAARRCAYSKRWQPALDRGGRPIASSLILNVRFTR